MSYMFGSEGRFGSGMETSFLATRERPSYADRDELASPYYRETILDPGYAGQETKVDKERDLWKRRSGIEFPVRREIRQNNSSDLGYQTTAQDFQRDYRPVPRSVTFPDNIPAKYDEQLINAKRRKALSFEEERLIEERRRQRELEERLEREEQERIKKREQRRKQEKKRQEEIKQFEQRKMIEERNQILKEELRRKKMQEEEYQRQRVLNEQLRREKMQEEEYQRKQILNEQLRREKMQEEEYQRQQVLNEELRRKNMREEEQQRQHGLMNLQQLLNDRDFLDFVQMKRMRESGMERSDDFQRRQPHTRDAFSGPRPYTRVQYNRGRGMMTLRRGNRSGGGYSKPNQSQNRNKGYPKKAQTKKKETPQQHGLSKTSGESRKLNLKRRERTPLPEKLWFCSVCDVDTQNESEHAKHLETSTHEEAFKKHVCNLKQKVVELQRKKRMSLANHNPKFCDGCVLPYIEELNVVHTDDKDHKEMARYRHCLCFYCNFLLFSREEYELHKLSVRHIKTVRAVLMKNGQLEETFDCPEEYTGEGVGEEYVKYQRHRYCKLCGDVTAAGQKHCKTEQHFNNIKKAVQERKKLQEGEITSSEKEGINEEINHEIAEDGEEDKNLEDGEIAEDFED